MSLLLESQEGCVRVLTLNDPDRPNLLSGELCAMISAAVGPANDDEELKAIVITGAGSSFCAGAHLSDLEAAARGDRETLYAVCQSFLDVANSPLPTIAAVNGHAVGAGLNQALACDIRLASVDVRCDRSFLKIGLPPGCGHSWMLDRVVGWAQAARMLLLNTPVDAVEAREIGLAHDVLKPGELLDRAVALASRTQALPRVLLVRTKQSLRFAHESDYPSTLAHEAEEQLHSLQQPAFKDLVQRLKGQIGGR